MEFSAQQIADYLKGKVVGNPEIKVSNFSKIEEGVPGTLTFLSNPKYTEYIYTTQASIVLVNDTFEPRQELKPTLIKVPNSYDALASLLTMVDSYKPKKSGISPLACVSEKATFGENPYVGAYTCIEDGAIIGKNAQIYPQVYIGDNMKIGDNVTLYPGVKIYKECVIGNNCTIHAGTVIGSDGFGFAPTADGKYDKIPQIGIVVIEDDVEIGANTTVDRSTMGVTIIKRGVKIDNLVQIAHNVEVGEDTVIAAQSGIAGSAKIGKHCMFGGQSGVVGHLTVADGTMLAAKCGVSNNIKEPNGMYHGFPHVEARAFQRAFVCFRNFPAIRNQILDLEKQVAELKKMVEQSK
ncbi:MAG: UDP-3-O-(3-hydroxymyristoyl)glucosamine N-acyltransferase [Paludibacteraceae bacterium]|nr:UDP-3-O-(3-hydroxymyristoyl)glucosamine N-acyltransferase [Paludibacteraceae bacterium]